MKEITSKWRQFLLSESQNHYEVEILLKYAGDMSLYGDVFNKIRAIPGVTIVKRKEEDVVQSVGGQKIVKLNVKFIPPRALMSRYLDILKAHMLKIKDEDGDKVMGIRFLSQPSTTEK
jgi:hypothetical protein